MEQQMMPATLAELLKKKGIGPEGSKSLKMDELVLVQKHFLDQEVSLTTKATMLTALLLLEPNKDEQHWIEALRKNPELYLPEILLPFIRQETPDPFVRLVLKLISKTELTEGEARLGMKYLLNPSAPEYLKGPFLEGERLKRESFAENKIFFEFLWSNANRIQTEIPLLIDICDSYDGCTRSPNFSVFVAALLAAAGFPAYLHAIDEVAPKEGLTSHQVLKAAGKNPLRPLQATVSDVQKSDISWGYVDQSVYFPALYNLKRVRREMVKRPFLATFEKLLQPIRAKEGNSIFTGYTHPHYRTELVNQLAHQHQCRMALVVKGAEGSTQLGMNKSTSGVFFDGNTIHDVSFEPIEFGCRPPAKPGRSMSPSETAAQGIAALQGERNDARENIVYTAIVVLTSFGLAENDYARQALESAIDSGKALRHWEKGCL